MPASKAQQKAQNKWISKAYDRINLTMPKGKKEIIQDCAAAIGVSVNAYINAAIDETMERDNAGEVTGGPTASPAGGDGILYQDTLKSAQRAAEATGEGVPQFIARAVETQAQRDKASLSMGLNPAKKAPDKKPEA